MNANLIFSLVSIYLFASVAGLQCGSRTCPDENQCCHDAQLGYTCYDPTSYSCSNNQVNGLTLCPSDDKACGPACYPAQDYQCCSGQLIQASQSCVTQTTTAPTTQSPTTRAPTTAPPTTAAPTTQAATTAPAGYACANYGGSQVVYCSSGSLCCGEGQMSVSCLPADGSMQCCEHGLAAGQGSSTQTCAGSGGPGASSYVFCCNAGTFFCEIGQFGQNQCCASGSVCCGSYDSYSYCCGAGTTCNTTTYGCNQ